MSARFTIRKSGIQFHFNLFAANGEGILSSGMYASKAGAETGIASVKTNASDDARYERKTSTADQPYFVLKAANHEVIGTSEMYSSPAARETGIESVKTNAHVAPVVDETA